MWIIFFFPKRLKNEPSSSTDKLHSLLFWLPLVQSGAASFTEVCIIKICVMPWHCCWSPLIIYAHLCVMWTRAIQLRHQESLTCCNTVVLINLVSSFTFGSAILYIHRTDKETTQFLHHVAGKWKCVVSELWWAINTLTSHCFRIFFFSMHIKHKL